MRPSFRHGFPWSKKAGSVLTTTRGISFLLAAAVLLAAVTARSATLPEPPRVFLDTTYSPPPGRTIFVAAGGDFQAALNQAQRGDTIVLEAGASFTGNFLLPNKSGSEWIVIRTSTPDNTLPPEGTRINPSFSGLMPKIVSPNTSPAIRADQAAHHYRFIGVEITTTHASTGSTLYNVVLLGDGNETSISQLPSDIIFDRSYIHGTPTGNVRRGIALNGVRIAVIDSYLSDFHEVGQDSQAVMAWNGPGPFKIVNNYLEGAGENVLFGGTDPRIADLVPSDIEVTGNHFFKPLKWRVGDPSYAGIHWSVKNILELKNARRVLIDGNIFEQNWADAQNGFSILFTVRNQNGGAPWSVVEDVTFTNNVLRHATAGINILGRDDISGSSQQTKRILIKDNLFDDIGGGKWGYGRLFQLGNGAADVTVDHNTALHTEDVIFAYAASTTGFIYQNNLSPHNALGVIGDGTGTGNSTLSSYFPGSIFAKTILAGGNPANYPAGNYFPGSLSNVEFVDLAGGDYRLAATSPYKNAGTDGKDIGADIDALTAATAGVIEGTAGSDPPPDTTDSTAPVISGVSAPLIGSSEATIMWSTDEASDSQVEYGLTNPTYGSSSALSTSMITSHSRTLTGLSPNTLYYYRAKSRDAAGNLAVSGGFSFTTLAAADIIPPTASISVSPASLSFGSVTVGSTSAAQGVQITNTGSVGVSVSSVAIAGPFAISENLCIATGTWDGVMAPGTHCDISVVSAPVAGGDASGTLSISAAGSVYPVTLSGTGVVPAASVSVAPTSLSFGSVTVGSTSVAQGVQITNTGSVGVSVSSVTIAGPFAISENYCTATGTWNGVVAPGTHCDLSVVFAPVAGGDASGTLSISAAGSVYPATLSGTGAALADVTPPTDSLAGHWKLDEGNSTNAGDSSGNGNTGKLKGRPTWTTGKEGFAVAFDGTNDYVSIPNDASLNAYPLTIAAWIKTSATGLQGIVNKYSRNSFKGYQLLSNGGNLCAWYFKDKSNYIGDGTDCPLATPGYNDDQWHHVAFVVDSTGGRLYVDGSEKASLAWTGTPGATSTGQALSFGRYPKMSGSYFSGDLDDVRIYSRALSADEVEALFYAAISSAP